MGKLIIVLITSVVATLILGTGIGYLGTEAGLNIGIIQILGVSAGFFLPRIIFNWIMENDDDNQKEL